MSYNNLSHLYFKYSTATPRIYPSKRVQKCPKRPRIEGDTANFNEFCEISCNSFSFDPKIMFLDSFESSRVGLSQPVLYPRSTPTRNPSGLPQPLPFPTWKVAGKLHMPKNM